MKDTIKSLTTRLVAPITEVPPLLQSSYFPSLDGLRAISIIIVLAYHMLLKLDYGAFSGGFGVQVFFVISGFIITTLLLKEKITKGTVFLRGFYIRRAIKILPIAYLYLLVVGILNLWYHNIDPMELVAAGLFVKNTHLLGTAVNAPPGHFWSLSVEEQFYLLFPFILKKNVSVFFCCILFLIVFIPVALVCESKNLGMFAAPGTRLFLDFFRNSPSIIIGALLSLLIFKKLITGRLYPNNLFTNICFFVLAYICYVGIELPDFTLYTKWICPFIVAAIIANNISRSDDLFYKFLNSKIMVTIGLASYSIYIWQQLFLLEIPWENDYPFTQSPLFGMPAALIAGFCSYFFIEKKLAVLKRKFR